MFSNIECSTKILLSFFLSLFFVFVFWNSEINPGVVIQEYIAT